MRQDDLSHHRIRVGQELDRAYRATATAAVHSHLKLAALHMNRVDELVRAARPHQAKSTPAVTEPVHDVTADLLSACC